MRTFHSRFVAVLVLGGLLGACGSSASPSPIVATPVPSTAAASRTSVPPDPATPTPTVSATVQPTTETSTTSTVRPIRASAREISAQEARLAPGPDGSLFISISIRTGPAILMLLDRSGRPRAGWPVEIKGSTRCGVPFSAGAGSVRIVCDARDRPGVDFDDPEERAFAFDAAGRLMPGWPVRLEAPTSVGMGTGLTVLTERSADDPTTDDIVLHEASISTIADDGTVSHGSSVALPLDHFGYRWSVGPDGVGVGIVDVDEDADLGAITALDGSGTRPGWPVQVHGFGSAATFAVDGEIVIALGSAKTHRTRVSVLDSRGIAHTSAGLPIATAERTGETGGCTASLPQAPVVAPDGTVVVYSELDDSIFALDRRLAIKHGWPFEPATALQVARAGLESEHEAGYCPTPVVPAVGADATLYLALQARSSKVGGSLIAVGPNGKVRTGWPVELKRPGAEFWSVVAGPDGTVHALAIEPESGGKSSASILAIAPDSTVRWTTTIIDP